jgi:primosomal protein N' (replication factor Y)
MEKRIAEVVVPRDIDRPFDYLIPDEHRLQVQVGVRVRVPFHGERVTGFVVGLKSESDYRGKLLPITEVLHPRPVLDARNLALARWICDYYLAPLGMVLPAMMPTGVRPRAPQTRAHVRLRGDLAETLRWVESLSAAAPRQVALLHELLSLGGAPPMRELLDRVGCSEGPLRALAERGLIEIEHRPVVKRPSTPFHERSLEITLTDEQHHALEAIRDGLRRGHGRFLLHGVNASGKTEVYLQSVQGALELDRDAVVIVPEISLTPQLIARFQTRFGSLVAVYHSGLTGAQRAREWERIVTGEARVVIGVRAAIFAPVGRLGLIVVDEEHEPTYKQDDPAPRYHAREVALRRAELEDAVVVLGSATPSIESYYRARRGGLQLIELRERAVGGLPPQVEILDMKGEDRLLSPTLKRKIAARLKAGEQALLLINLRGFSRVVFCRKCRTTQTCSKCGIALVYHYRGQRLRCHTCGGSYRVGNCRACGSRELAFFGAGTQQVEQVLREAFPRATIVRMDSDAVRRGQHGEILEHFRRGEIQILLGTQMIGLGLDFPNVTLVGVLAADTLLDLPDFRAGERTFQLISQAIGRAGRGDKPGEVVIQTNHPEHYAIAQAARRDYRAFYEEELIFRESLGYPPFAHLVKITCEDRKQDRAQECAAQLGEALLKADAKGLEVLGPFKALPYRVRGQVRWQLVLKTRDVRRANALVRDALTDLKSSVQIKIDVDPQSLIV